jgi:hypothetical protein
VSGQLLPAASITRLSLSVRQMVAVVVSNCAGMQYKVSLETDVWSFKAVVNEFNIKN